MSILIFYSTRMSHTCISWPSLAEWWHWFFYHPPIFAVPEQKFCVLAQTEFCWASLGRSAFQISAPYSVPKMQIHECEFIDTDCPIPPPISFIFFPLKTVADQLGRTAAALQENAAFQRSKPKQAQEECAAALASPTFLPQIIWVLIQLCILNLVSEQDLKVHSLARTGVCLFLIKHKVRRYWIHTEHGLCWPLPTACCQGPQRLLQWAHGCNT